MENESKIESDRLQQLVDGELSADEVRVLFEAADQNPGQFRTIACAFAEDQLFARQFETLAAHLESERPNPTSQPKPATLVTGKLTTRRAAREKASQTSSLLQRLAIVASLALVGLIGYMVGSDGDSPTRTPNGPNTTNMIADNQPAEPSTLTPVDLQPEYRMELLTPDGESIDGEVDLYRYNDLHQLVKGDGRDRSMTLDDFLPPSGFSPEARERLSRSGYEINESTNYMSGRLQDGRQFVVPVRSIRFDQGH